MKKVQKCIDWADLPDNIVEIIFERLSLMDCMSVTDVCKAWRHVATQGLSGWHRHGLPWLLMSGEKDKRERTCISILMAQEWKMMCPETLGRNCWGSHQDWLVLVKYTSLQIDIILFNPFTQTQIGLPKTNDFYSHIVLSGLPYHEYYICMLLEHKSQNLAFWVPGAQSWVRHKQEGDPFEDAVFFSGSFYLISKDYNVCEIKYADIFSAIKRDDAFTPLAFNINRILHKVTMSDDLENDRVLKYLVESCGKLLLVCRFLSTRPTVMPKTKYFKVYVLDFSQMSWKRLESLGDRVLFLGKCCSRSVSSSGVGVNKTDCIYFTNDSSDPTWNEWNWHCIEINSDDRDDWGCFSLGNEIEFWGKYSWGPVWCTAPQWWCCKNSRMLKRLTSHYFQGQKNSLLVENPPPQPIAAIPDSMEVENPVIDSGAEEVANGIVQTPEGQEHLLLVENPPMEVDLQPIADLPDTIEIENPVIESQEEPIAEIAYEQAPANAPTPRSPKDAEKIEDSTPIDEDTTAGNAIQTEFRETAPATPAASTMQPVMPRSSSLSIAQKMALILGEFFRPVSVTSVGQRPRDAAVMVVTQLREAYTSIQANDQEKQTLESLEETLASLPSAHGVLLSEQAAAKIQAKKARLQEQVSEKKKSVLRRGPILSKGDQETREAQLAEVRARLAYAKHKRDLQEKLMKLDLDACEYLVQALDKADKALDQAKNMRQHHQLGPGG